MNKKIIILFFIPMFIILSYLQASAQENLTITTYYPSPSGSYNELRVEHIAIGYMNRTEACWDPPCPGFPSGQDISDNLAAIPPRNIDLIVEGSVGIGTMAPSAALDVAGGVKFGNDTALCDATNPDKEGTVRYNSTDNVMEYCDGTQWAPIGESVGSHSTTFDITGAQDFTVPPGVTYLNLQLWGAGGGGGGSLFNPNCYASCEGAGGGAGGGGYIEAGYIVAEGQTYTITVGVAGQGGAFITSTTKSADVGTDGGDTTFVNKSTGTVIFNAGGGNGGKGFTQSMCCSGADGAARGTGGIAFVVDPAIDPNVNLIKKVDGENGTRLTLSSGNADGGAASNGGYGGEMCGCDYPAANCYGGLPGGGGAGGVPGSICSVVRDQDGGNGGKGKVVVIW